MFRTKNLITFILLFLFFTHSSDAQSYVFGAKLGPSIGLQTWDGFDREPMLAYHFAAYIESYDDDAQSTLYAQLGMHVRGSSNRVRFFTFNNAFTSSSTFKFNNLALILAAKRRISMDSDKRPYYLIGIRGEYTISTNLDKFEERNEYFNSLFYPAEPFVKKFNYGFVAGGGFEFMFSEFVGGILEFTFSPDVSKQYDQPPIGNVVDPLNVGSTRNISARKIRNLSFEISLGIRLLRKVEYYD